jgi:MFS family permease
VRRVLVPLALTQFVASFAGSNMNVAISSIAKDIGTDVHGVQTAITLFLLCMAALMLPGSKLTDKWGRKRCLMLGLTIYGAGAVLASFAQGLPLLIVGYSGFEGVGSALMIPPIYILATLFFEDTQSRAKAFGVISGMAGVGAAAGPLIGGLITTAISWRVSFLLQAAIVASIVFLTRSLKDPLPADPARHFDIAGAVLGAAGMFFVVLGVLQAKNSATLLAVFLALGAVLLLWFILHVRAEERRGREPLMSLSLFRNRTSNFGLVTQNIQWLVLMGVSFVVSVFLQTVRGFSAIRTGVIFTAATAGVLLASLAAERWSKRYRQKGLICAGFVVTIAGMGLLLALVKESQHQAAFLPGLFLIGLGVGTMLTPSVNVVQSAFPDEQQGEISGVSRSVSNLGSSLGTAIAGTILVSDLASGNRSYVLATAVLGGFALVGLGAGLLLPHEERPIRSRSAPSAQPQPASGPR